MSLKINQNPPQTDTVHPQDFRTALRSTHDTHSASQTRIPETRSVSVASQRSPTKNVNFAPDTSFERNVSHSSSVQNASGPAEVSLSSINSINASKLGTLESTSSFRSHGLGSSVGRMNSSQALFSCRLIYLGCRDCEKFTGPAAVERSVAKVMGGKTVNSSGSVVVAKPNSSLVDFKIQKSGVTGRSSMNDYCV